jgi:hypothetical protein
VQKPLTAEKAIHVVMFILILIGLCGLSAWVIYNYVQNDLLRFGGIALSWGVVLLVLYVSFRQFKWDWWS